MLCCSIGLYPICANKDIKLNLKNLKQVLNICDFKTSFIKSYRLLFI